MHAIGKLQKPKVYRLQVDGFGASSGEYTYSSIRPYFPANHPNTMWIINRVRADDPTPLVNILKARKRMNIFFKYMYFQILDRPSLYNPKAPMDKPMFSEKAYLFLNIFAVALYFKCESIAQVLAPIRVGKLDNQFSYEALSEVSIPQYASYVHDHSFGDLMTFSIPVVMMRREAYFAIPLLFKFGSWAPRNQFTISYYRRHYNCTKKFNDWLEYAWQLLTERPYTKISMMVYMLNKSAHQNFYLGDKVFFQPINCRYYNAPWVSPSQDERAMIVFRSYPRRLLCKLFLCKDPLRILPQVVPFVRMFQSNRYFVAQTTRAMNPEFRAVIHSSLEERFLNISPICNSNELNSSDYVEQNSHKTSIYDYDNIIALLLYFLVKATDRNVQSLQHSIVQLVMDILVDTNLVYIFSKEPAVNLSYYMSMLIDGPFIQPIDLQVMLRSIPNYLVGVHDMDKCFPPYLHTSGSRYDRQQQFAQNLFKTKLPGLWESGAVEQAIQLMLKYRIDIDDTVGVTTLEYCDWKNEYLTARLKLSLQTMNQEQQTIPAERVDQRMTADDEGGHHGVALGWRAYPPFFFRDAKEFMVKRQRDASVKKKKLRRNYIDLWTMDELEVKRPGQANRRQSVYTHSK
ncbi:hypothetical protein BOX15_Mlig033073g3 [Macrostomum lignano]|uniref:Uncharacterized protein n=2 Tax=Macrostomum lignano TaxID=282301 RepID=A0A267DR78_9PLAT|nr:hypothetical protein BOX15_Mlig033073g3 [Macrostomum lignano]